MMAGSHGGGFSDATSADPPPGSIDHSFASDEELSRQAFWDYLDPAARSALSKIAQSRVFPRGCPVVHDGEVLIIRTGWAKVTATVSATRNEVMLRLHGPGDLIGDEVALTGRPHRAAIVAVTDVRALALPATDFMSAITTHPGTARALYRAQEDRLDDAEQRMIVATTDGSVRIAQLLLALCDRYGKIGPRGITIPVPLTQADLAAWSGTSRKTVVRALGEMRTNGLIATGYRSLTVTSPARLRTYLTAALGPTLTHRLLLAMDVEWPSSRTGREQLRIQENLRDVLTLAAENVGLDRKRWYEQASGDGELAVLPEDTDASLLVGNFTRQLQLVLAKLNQARGAAPRLRLRVAIHHGPVTPGPFGPVGEAPVVVGRLLTASPLRSILAGQSDRDVALILSAPLYHDIVHTGFSGLDPDGFEAVDVNAKGILYKGFVQKRVDCPSDESGPTR